MGAVYSGCEMIGATANINVPYVLFTLDEEEHNLFKKISQKFQSDIKNKKSLRNGKHTLAGQIENEYHIDDEEISNKIINILNPAVGYHYDNYNYLKDLTINSTVRPLKLDKVWINLQKKYEYNPAHFHSGVLSFVIWVEIPYLIEDENNHPTSKGSTFQCNGNFYFLNAGIMPLTNCNVQPTVIKADKTFEGKGLLFPSYLMHGVYPFYTSNKYRVSISGNFVIDVG